MSGDVLAVIPARGGSKGVPGKNLAPVGGVPLVVRAIRAATAAHRVTAVAVSTDDPAIAAAASRAGAIAVHRPDRPEVVLLVQCTSPFLTAGDIDAVVSAVLDTGADTAFTAASFHGFIWRDAGATGVNHDPRGRLRRQDREPEWLETGAAYAMRADGFAEQGRRFFGRTVAVPTDPARVLEVDEPADLARARALAPLLDAAVRPAPGEVDAVVLDFDGTQTDDRAWLAADGTERVAVHRGDGMGVAALRRAGIEATGVELADWRAEKRLAPGRVLYLGNDVNDLPCFEQVGWPVAVASAHQRVRAAARAVTTVPGGHGAVREIASWILEEDQL